MEDLTEPRSKGKLTAFFTNIRLARGARKLTGENLKAVWAEFSTFKLGCFVMYAIAQHIQQAHPNLELKTRPRFCPSSHGQTLAYRTSLGPSFQL